MLLADYKRVIEIDSTINDLHEQLSSLYNERANIVFAPEELQSTPELTTINTRQTIGTTIDNKWELSSYNELRQIWADFDIVIPIFNKLQPKLLNAKRAISNLQLQLQDSSFTLLLVPPAVIIHKLVKNGIFEQNGVNLAAIQQTVRTAKSRSWTLHIVATDPITVTSESELLVADNHQRISGYEMSGLSTTEYAIYVLTNPQIVDENSWSILTRSINAKEGTITCVSYLGNSYQFENDLVDVLIGNNHFRPAMEIK